MSQVTAGKLSEFKPIKRNSNKHTVRGLAALDHSIEQDGYVAPMTAAADGAVLDGNARLERSFEKLGDEAIVIHHDGTKPIVMVRDDIPNEDDPRAKSIHYRANTVQWLDFALDSAVVMADIEAGFNFESIDVSLPDLGELLKRDVEELLRGEAGNWDDAFGKVPTEDRPQFQQMTFTLHDSQVEIIKAAIAKARGNDFTDSPNENSNGNALYFICREFNGQREGN